MAKRVLLNSRIFAGGVDLTSNANKIELNGEVEEKDSTNFGSGGWKEVLGSLGSASLGAAGQWEAGDSTKVDNGLWSGLGGVDAWSVYEDSASPGSVGYLLKALQPEYKLFDAVGEVAPWEAKAASTWPLVRGVSLHDPGTARTATGTGTSVQHQAVATGKYLYAALHVLSVSGTAPSLTVAVESDDNSGFTSGVTRITFDAATAVGGQIQRLAGPITDDFYRVAFTIAGTSPSFLFVVSLGVM